MDTPMLKVIQSLIAYSHWSIQIPLLELGLLQTAQDILNVSIIKVNTSLMFLSMITALTIPAKGFLELQTKKDLSGLLTPWGTSSFLQNTDLHTLSKAGKPRLLIREHCWQTVKIQTATNIGNLVNINGILYLTKRNDLPTEIQGPLFIVTTYQNYRKVIQIEVALKSSITPMSNRFMFKK